MRKFLRTLRLAVGAGLVGIGVLCNPEGAPSPAWGADTYTTNLRIVQQVPGSNANTWGTKANAAFAMLDEAVSKVTSISVTAGNVTLTSANNATDQARSAVLIFTGTPGTTRTVTAPNVQKLFYVYNNSDSTITFNGGAGTTVSIPSGAKVSLYTDGATNAVSLAIISTFAATVLDDATAAAARTTLVAAASGANSDITSVLLNNTGLVVKGGSANALTIKPGSTLSTGRTLTVTTGDADRLISIAGDLTTAGAFTTAGTFTTAGAFTTSGGNALTLTTTAPTNVTLPTSGTLLTAASGTLTPTVTFGGASVGVTYSNNTCAYTTIANRVIFTCTVILTNKGSSTGIAALAITWPQTPAAQTGPIFIVPANVTIDTGGGYLGVYGVPSASGLDLKEWGSAVATTTLSNTNFANNSQIYVNGEFAF